MQPLTQASDLDSCRILAEDPDLGAGLSPSERERAADDCVASTMRIARGRWTVDISESLHNGIGLLVLEGLLLRRVGIDGRFGAELLGEGDLLRPWQGEDRGSMLTQTTGWRVLAPLRVALLDVHAAECFAAYPELTGSLVGRALERARNLAINMAIVHQARVNVRLRMLFWHLADRWGRVRTEGIVLPLTLTHTVLADLVAARRPTVTTALNELNREGSIQAARGGWLLSGDPPGELLALRNMDLPASSG